MVVVHNMYSLLINLIVGDQLRLIESKLELRTFATPTSTSNVVNQVVSRVLILARFHKSLIRGAEMVDGGELQGGGGCVVTIN